MRGKRNIPNDLFYTEYHTWVLVDDAVATIGITDYGQSELSEIMFVELPAPGDELVQGTSFGTIEGMKTVAELIAPMSGEVIEINDGLETDPRQVNADPYGDGWMVRISLRDPEEAENILTPQDYLLIVSEDAGLF